MSMQVNNTFNARLEIAAEKSLPEVRVQGAPGYSQNSAAVLSCALLCQVKAALFPGTKEMLGRLGK